MKKIFFILILFLLLFNFVHAVEIDYFGADLCTTCLKSKEFIKTVIDKQNINITIREHNILNKQEEELFIKYNNYYKISPSKFKVIPAIFIGDKYLVGYEDIRDNFEKYISVANRNIDMEEIEETSINTQPVTILGVITAGFLDGINPCSIAMLLFFISFIMTINNKTKILTTGLCFIVGTIIAYFLIGIGLFNFIYTLQNIKAVAVIFYYLLLIMSVFLAGLNLHDLIRIKMGNIKKIKNQLSKNRKKSIHNFIKKHNSNKAIHITAFFTAFIISFLEFFCTGQIYLPTITFMINSGYNNYLWLLLLYNIFFIVPLVFILLLLYAGKEIIDISSKLVENLIWIKLAGTIFFIGNSIYAIFQIYKIGGLKCPIILINKIMRWI